jgi:hypothetical protein
VQAASGGESAFAVDQAYGRRFDLYAFGKKRILLSSACTTNGYDRVGRSLRLRKFGSESGTGEVVVVSEKADHGKGALFRYRTVGFCIESGKTMRISESAWSKLLSCDDLTLSYDRRNKCLSCE